MGLFWFFFQTLSYICGAVGPEPPAGAEAHWPAVVIFYILHIYISEELEDLTLIISEELGKIG